MNRSSISVLIPSYNEQVTLGGVFYQCLDVLKGLQVDFEIILCDDASLDHTGEIIKELLTHCPQARAIYHQQNQGIFKTFEELYQAASKDLVILFPGDGQWDPGLLRPALEAIQGYDVLIAARRHKQYTVFRQINSWTFNNLVKALYGIDLYDIGTVKLCKREILQTIPVETQSAFSEAERLLKARKKGYKFNVIWVEHKDRKGGKAAGAKLKNVIKAFKDLVLFRFKY